jgi:hypothetical protein
VFIENSMKSTGLLDAPSMIVMVSVVMSLPTRLLTVFILRKYDAKYATGGYMHGDESIDGMGSFYTCITFFTSPLPWIALGFMVYLGTTGGNPPPVNRTTYIFMCVFFLCMGYTEMVLFYGMSVPPWIAEPVVRRFGAHCWVFAPALLALCTWFVWHTHSRVHTVTRSLNEWMFLVVLFGLGCSAVVYGDLYPLTDT